MLELVVHGGLYHLIVRLVLDDVGLLAYLLDLIQEVQIDLWLHIFLVLSFGMAFLSHNLLLSGFQKLIFSLKIDLIFSSEVLLC